MLLTRLRSGLRADLELLSWQRGSPYLWVTSSTFLGCHPKGSEVCYFVYPQCSHLQNLLSHSSPTWLLPCAISAHSIVANLWLSWKPQLMAESKAQSYSTLESRRI